MIQGRVKSSMESDKGEMTNDVITTLKYYLDIFGLLIICWGIT